QAQLTAALAAARMSAWDWDLRTGEMVWNEQHADLFGVDFPAFPATYEAFERFVHPDDRERLSAAVRAAVRSRGQYECEYRFRRPDGPVRWMLGRGQVLVDETGQPARMTGVVLDLTERRAVEAERLAASRREAEEAARASRVAELSAALAKVQQAARREHAFAEIAATVAYAGSLEEILDAVAAAVVEATDMPACAVVLVGGEPLDARVAGTHGLPEDYPALFDAAWRAGAPLPALRAYDTQRPVVVRDVEEDPALGTPPGGRWRGMVCLPLIARGTPVGAIKVLYRAGQDPDESGIGFLQTVADQAAIAVDNARLFVHAQEKAALEERQRLARELHDSVTQSLFSMTLLARAGQLGLERARVGPDSPVAQALRDLQELSRTALAEMRALIFELRPGSIAEEGLVVGLRKLVQALRARTSLPIEVYGPDEPLGLPPATEEQLYRIAQEALRNVVKHARASQATVRVDRTGDGTPGWTLEVGDDGAGFAPGGIRPGHFGLTMMAERTERVRGRLEVTSAPGRGTTVRVSVPAPPADVGQPVAPAATGPGGHGLTGP
ncbi:MAG TPA: PAS domain-containing protein, partial [Frankiaceae bacterium]|nr:PAS domain-containing protein [Frankiaceae bacterium]